MGHNIDAADHFIQVVIHQDRHNRAEDFFLHDRVGKCYVIHNRRFNTERFALRISAVYNFLFIDQTRDSVKMLFIDDLP